MEDLITIAQENIFLITAIGTLISLIGRQIISHWRFQKLFWKLFNWLWIVSSIIFSFIVFYISLSSGIWIILGFFYFIFITVTYSYLFYIDEIELPKLSKKFKDNNQCLECTRNFYLPIKEKKQCIYCKSFKIIARPNDSILDRIIKKIKL